MDDKALAWEKKLNTRWNNEYRVIQYTGSRERAIVEHLPCGSILDKRADNIYGHYCKKCTGNMIHNTCVKRNAKKYEEIVGEIFEEPQFSDIDRSMPLDLVEYLEELGGAHIEPTMIAFPECLVYYISLPTAVDPLGCVARRESSPLRVIQIFSDEWVQKKEIVKAKLRHILKKDNLPLIYPRNCIIDEIDTRTKNDFLDKYHIQGGDRSTLRLGMFDPDGDLIAVMTFIANNRNKHSIKEDTELVRFATKDTVNIPGGFSKMLKYAIKNYKFINDTISTFADLRWSADDSVYKKAGFEYVDRVKPTPWFITDETKRHHFRLLIKEKLKEKFPDLYDERLTAKQIAARAGFLQIWDAGNDKFIWKIKKD